MRIIFRQSLYLRTLLVLSALVFTSDAMAQTHRFIIGSEDGVLTRQQAAREKEQWDSTRTFRTKVNQRAEKEWDKADVAFDAEDNCYKSTNFNAYWEPNTLRCLDRRTGHEIMP